MTTAKSYLLSFLLLFITNTANASLVPETGWLRNFNHLHVQVNMQLTGQVDDNSVNALLNISLDPEWKTYWRSPGEGGVAPTLQWEEQSTNIAELEWFWPAPKRYPVLGVETLGYQDQLLLPMHIKVQDINKMASLQGVLTIASCTTICVLSDYQIDLSFTPADLIVDQDIAFAYAQAYSKVPVKLTQQEINQQGSTQISELLSSWEQVQQQVVVQVTRSDSWKVPDLFVDSSDPALLDVFFSKPVISISGNQLTARFDATSWAGEVDLSQSKFNITVVDNNLALEVASQLSEQVIKAESPALASIFVIALIGGLILNIMPCVLPVLGMKLSSVVSAQNQQKSLIRKQFIASSIGIISSFWLLALFLLILKLSGQALGWGIQFQNPYFIGFMVLVTALFTANMLGLFEIQLPASMQTWLATKGGDAYLGHYLQGMFATLLATPCSAPFLGTAVAFALGASTWQLFAIFSALGLGMALPWVVIALFPSIAFLLPKPGKWMGVVKLIFGLLIFVTCLWLVSLLANFIGVMATAIIASCLFVALALLIYSKHGKRVFVVAFASLLVAGVIGFVVGELSHNQGVAARNQELSWQVLDTQLIKDNVAQGNVVFVDVTADWCVTCQANKLGVLLQEPIHSALQQSHIVRLRGDWTVRSDSVTEYLQSFGQYGVPFNVVYGPGAPDGIVLSTLLTSDAVSHALQQAKGQ